jgi:hypothetical protein
MEKKSNPGSGINIPKLNTGFFVTCFVHDLCGRLGRGHREERAAVRRQKAGGPGRRGQDPSHDPRRDRLGGQGQYTQQPSPLLIKSGSLLSSVADPGSGSGSINTRYGSGSGSFYVQAKIVRKTLIPSVF